METLNINHDYVSENKAKMIDDENDDTFKIHKLLL